MYRIRTHWPVLILVALVFVVFHQAFISELVFWDDDVFILRNDILKMPFLQAVEVTFTSYYHGDYLPLTIMSYWFDVNIFGQEPIVFHTVNILLHSLNVVLVYSLIYLYKKDQIAALLVSLVFAIHPLQTEPVVWISERKSLISGAFTLLSLIGYIIFLDKKKPKYLIASAFMYIGSILSKTTAILLPIVFLLLDRANGKVTWRQSLIRLLPTFVVIAVLGYVRVISYDHSTPGVASSVFELGRLQMVPFFATNSLWFYVEKFFWPHPLSALYLFFEFQTYSYVESALGLAAVSFLLFIIYKKQLTDSKVFFVMCLLFLLPVLHIIPRANFVNDRYMYLPIIGFAFTIWEIIQSQFKIHLSPKRLTMVMVILALPMGLKAYSQSSIWKNNLALWEDTVLKNPDNILARNALGLEYHSRKRYDESIEQFNHVLRLEAPTSLKLKSINNLANVYTDKAYTGFNLDTAIKLYELGLSSAERPNMTYELRVNLAQTLYIKGEKEKFRMIMNGVYQEVLRDPDSRNHWLREYIPRALKQLQ